MLLMCLAFSDCLATGACDSVDSLSHTHKNNSTTNFSFFFLNMTMSKKFSETHVCITAHFAGFDLKCSLILSFKESESQKIEITKKI